MCVASIPYKLNKFRYFNQTSGKKNILIKLYSLPIFRCRLYKQGNKRVRINLLYDITKE